MTNRTLYGETWTPVDTRNILRLAAQCDGLPSYRVDFDINGKPLLSFGKEHVRPGEYLPSGTICPSLLEADGWSGRDSLYGVLTRTDVRGVTWDAVQGTGRGEHLRFSFRDVNNPYKRSPLILLGRAGYFQLFRGIGTLPGRLKATLLQLGYILEPHSTPSAASC